jgi:predicted RNase H-like nuclease (RuvC/YqgF family)
MEEEKKYISPRKKKRIKKRIEKKKKKISKLKSKLEIPKKSLEDIRKQMSKNKMKKLAHRKSSNWKTANPRKKGRGESRPSTHMDLME